MVTELYDQPLDTSRIAVYGRATSIALSTTSPATSKHSVVHRSNPESINFKAFMFSLISAVEKYYIVSIKSIVVMLDHSAFSENRRYASS